MRSIFLFHYCSSSLSTPLFCSLSTADTCSHPARLFGSEGFLTITNSTPRSPSPLNRTLATSKCSTAASFKRFSSSSPLTPSLLSTTLSASRRVRETTSSDSAHKHPAFCSSSTSCYSSPPPPPTSSTLRISSSTCARPGPVPIPNPHSTPPSCPLVWGHYNHALVES